jgi:hypothetical protein
MKYEFAPDDCLTAEEARSRAKRGYAWRQALRRTDAVVASPEPSRQEWHPPNLLVTYREVFIPLHAVIDVMAAHFELKPEELRTAPPTPFLIRVRHIGMFIASEITPAIFTQIAAAFGRSGHTATVDAVGRITKLLLDGHEETIRAVSAITERLQELYPNAVKVPQHRGRPRAVGITE